MSTDTHALTAENVEAVFMACLFKAGEDTSNRIVAEGLVVTVGFHPGRIEEHRQEIHDMLAELPDQFKMSGGEGYSFSEACVDKHGNQWTGLHQTMEQLFQLGMAIGEVEYTLPRDMWSIFPGGVPFMTVKQ